MHYITATTNRRQPTKLFPVTGTLRWLASLHRLLYFLTFDWLRPAVIFFFKLDSLPICKGKPYLKLSKLIVNWTVPLCFGVCLSFYCFFFLLYCVITVTPSRSLREEKEVSLLSWGWRNLQQTWISTKRRHFCWDWSRTLPDRRKWPGLTSSYERSNSGYAIKPKQKTVKRQADTEKQWNTSQVSLFYSFHWRKN